MSPQPHGRTAREEATGVLVCKCITSTPVAPHLCVTEVWQCSSSGTVPTWGRKIAQNNVVIFYHDVILKMLASDTSSCLPTTHLTEGSYRLYRIPLEVGYQETDEEEYWCEEKHKLENNLESPPLEYEMRPAQFWTRESGLPLLSEVGYFIISCSITTVIQVSGF